MQIYRKSDKVEVKVNYNRYIIEQFKIIGGGRWFKEDRVWRFPLEKYDALCDLKRSITGMQQATSTQQAIVNHSDHIHSTKIHGEIFNEQRDNDSSIDERRMTNNYNSNGIKREKIDHQTKYDGEFTEIAIKKRIESHRQFLVQKGYTPKTIKNYTNQFHSFLIYTQNEISTDLVNQYILYLLEIKHCSHTYCNQAINAIKLYIKQYTNINEAELMKLVRPKSEQKIPKVLSQNEVKRIIDSVENVKHKTELMLAYGCGLRVSEVAQLKVRHIDSERMIVIVSQGKGRKDRITLLSEKMLDQLREYFKLYKPQEWLFENPTKDGPISERSLQKIFNVAMKKAGIKKYATFHSDILLQPIC